MEVMQNLFLDFTSKLRQLAILNNRIEI